MEGKCPEKNIITGHCCLSIVNSQLLRYIFIKLCKKIGNDRWIKVVLLTCHCQKGSKSEVNNPNEGKARKIWKWFRFGNSVQGCSPSDSELNWQRHWNILLNREVSSISSCRQNANRLDWIESPYSKDLHAPSNSKHGKYLWNPQNHSQNKKTNLFHW